MARLRWQMRKVKEQKAAGRIQAVARARLQVNELPSSTLIYPHLPSSQTRSLIPPHLASFRLISPHLASSLLVSALSSL